MPTMKDVAKLAQVSMGTVSNVLNGKTRNSELIVRVENAMKELHYSPDATARSLKKTSTNSIGLVIPDLIQNHYSEFVMELEKYLRGSGYNLMIKFSRNNHLIEKKSIESFYELRMDGIILYTTLHQKFNANQENNKIPNVTISCQESIIQEKSNIIIDYKPAFCSLVRVIKQKGFHRIGLVLRQNLLEDGGLEEIFTQLNNNQLLIRVVDGSKERGFQAMFELIQLDKNVDCIIAGDYETAEGIRKAQSLLRIEVPVYTFKMANWIDDADAFSGVISLSPKALAKKVTEQILTEINSAGEHDNKSDHIYAQFNEMSLLQPNILQGNHVLNYAMYDCSSARSLQLLSQVYERESGQKIHFDLYPYNKLEELLYQISDEKSSYYDGFMMDITWQEELIKSGCVKKIDNLIKNNKNYFEGFIDDAINNYGMYKNSLYAIPFMPGAQILFYQKDLFESKSLQIKFQREYNEKLEPPKTWRKFNLVAQFFTKSYNPESPIKYGISMSSGINVYTTIDFLNRFWSYGGDLFDVNGKTTLHNNSGVKALRNLIKSHQYCSNKELHSWDSCAEEFESGDSAMVILYNSDAGSINNYTNSKVAGNLGYSLIPGETPVLGGWSIALNQFGEHQDEAEQFVLWACSSQNAIPSCILGGSTLRTNYYLQSDLEQLEPWKTITLKSIRESRKRVFPHVLENNRQKNEIYTYIIPKEIEHALNGEIEVEKALINMELEINNLVLTSSEI